MGLQIGLDSLLLTGALHLFLLHCSQVRKLTQPALKHNFAALLARTPHSDRDKGKVAQLADLLEKVRRRKEGYLSSVGLITVIFVVCLSR